METMFFVLCTTLPSHIIVFCLYWNFPWRSRRLALVLASCNVLLKMVCVHWIISLGGNIRGVEWIFSVIGFIIYFATLRLAWGKALFTFVLVVDYLSIVRGLATFLGVRLFSAQPTSWIGSLLCILIYVISLPWMLWFFRRTARTVFETDAPVLWNTIWMVPALITGVILLFTNTYDDDSSGSILFFISRMMLLLSIPVFYTILLNGLSSLKRQTVLEEQAQRDEQILTFQRSQYARLQTHMEEVRRARHDLRHHQKLIRSFLDSGDVEALRAYLDRECEQTATDQSDLQTYCRNYVVNSLLNYYAQSIRKAGTDLEIQVDLPEQLPISESDLCVAMGNLIENAQEACSGQEEPYIRIAARMTGKRSFALVVDNSAPSPPQRQPDGRFLSTKHAGYGIGTQSVVYISSRYNGTAQFQWENGVFYASVFFDPQENKTADKQ